MAAVKPELRQAFNGSTECEALIATYCFIMRGSRWVQMRSLLTRGRTGLERLEVRAYDPVAETVSRQESNFSYNLSSRTTRHAAKADYGVQPLPRCSVSS